MRKSKRGRACLEQLLGKAEKVVRLSPADVLVLIGVEDFDGPTLSRTLELFEEQGVEARGLIALEPGMDVESIDVEELIQMDQLAEAVDEGDALVNSRSSDEALTISVKCPRCPETLQMNVTATIHDMGDRLVGSTTVDSRDMELHAILCEGTKPTSQKIM